MPEKHRILIVDDEVVVARSVGEHLSRRSYDVSFAASHDEALRVFRVSNPALVLMDYTLPPRNGGETLERLKQIRPEVPVIMYSGAADADVIFSLSKLGADDFLTTPFQLNELYSRVARAIERGQSAGVRDAAEGRADLRGLVRKGDFAALFGTSPKMEEVKETIEQVAETTATVLIRGESGTGKEVVARMVYANSMRRDKPFVKVNCAAIPHELLESELFGYEPGAFTGANRQKLGKFEQANFGTIFLDEISEMHPALQAKLLHVLQDGAFARLGGKRDIQVDVRVLAATNKPLERAVEQGAFREDLFYRLNVVTIHIPPLRERREEIPIFVDFFVSKYSEIYGKNPPAFSDFAIQRMMEYSWPGNIRELENLVKRYVIVGNESQIIRELATHKPIVSSVSASYAPQATGMSHAQQHFAAGRHAAGVASAAAASLVAKGANGAAAAEPETLSLLEIGRRAAQAAEREAIERVLAQTRWNRRQAAKILKISYKALLNKLKVIEQQELAQGKHTTA